ncbi:hypothetical protein BDV96DRAFT_688497 [Lophiotrema nucula]|uniref:Uncharacterized protein n=1 Tax=Lophiotrema nucula TaxID=690887 RepID=A0A6A5Z3C6_9PLEO|nr:hypothetical protein BDV96DRAFT_688497 [Lophiotrema nucula]
MFKASQSILQFLCWSLNILVSRGGDGNLLHELDIFKSEAREARNSTLLLSFILASVAFIGLLRYTLGHTMASILTLQSLSIQNRTGRYENGGNNCTDSPLSRHLAASLRTLYAHQGIRIFTKALHIAAIYQLARTALKSFLTATLFRPVALQPLADIVSTVVLAEMHMYWTQATVLSGQGSTIEDAWHHDRQRWRKLVVPSVAQGGAVVLLDYVSRSLPETGTSAGNVSGASLSAVAVLRAFAALVVRSFVLSPLSAWLTLVEASCLNPGQETLVYERGKGRFVSGSVLFAGGFERPVSARELGKRVSLDLCLRLLELHVKKCVVQMLLEGLVSSIVGFVA